MHLSKILFKHAEETASTFLYLLYFVFLQVLDILVVLRHPSLIPFKLAQTAALIITLPSICLRYWRNKRIPEQLTFGSTPMYTAVRLLKIVSAQKGQRFLDLGSGKGHMVFVAALAYGMDGTGIEVQRVYHKTARLIGRFLWYVPVHLLHQDFLDGELPPADVIFVSNTCFPRFLEVILTKKLETSTMGTIVISLSAPLESEKVRVIKRMRALFSWGPGTVYIHRVER